MKKVFFTLLITFVLLGGLTSLVPVQIVAADPAPTYTPLAPIKTPGGGEVPTNDFPAYLQAMYKIGIGACFVLGVIMFTWAGIEYIISESMNTKGDAKKRITAALIGLAIALLSYLLLYTINPNLLKIQDLSTQVSTSPTAP
jgi:hypothetical protein